MGGVHVLYRKTNASTYVAANSTLYLPSTCYCRNNNSSYEYGAFPEFFHGLYYGSYGLDSGIGYKDGGFRILFWCNEYTASTQSGESAAFSRPTNGQVVLRSYLSNGKLCTRVETTSGSTLASLDMTLISAAYTRLSAGCTINREATIAMNAPYTLPAPAYYSQFKFTNTTLTTVSGSYVALSTSNSYIYVKNKNDDLPSSYTSYYASNLLESVMEGNYVADVSTATMNKSTYPVSAIV